MGFTADEDRLREVITANPWFGRWDEWDKAHFSHLPVFTRAALAHLYGRHDDTERPYQFCVLCSTFRVHPDRSLIDAHNLADMAEFAQQEENAR